MLELALMLLATFVVTGLAVWEVARPSRQRPGEPQEGASRFHAQGLAFDWQSLVLLVILFVYVEVMSWPFVPRPAGDPSLSEVVAFHLEHVKPYLLWQMALPGAIALLLVVGIRNGKWGDLGLTWSGFRPGALLKGFLSIAGHMGATVLCVGLLHFLGGIPIPDSTDDPTTVLLENAPLWFVLVGVVVLGPFSEEVVFRGMLYPLLARVTGPAWGAVLSGILFSLAHPEQNWVGFLVRAAIGISLARIYERCGSLPVVVALHGAYNGGIYLLYLALGV